MTPRTHPAQADASKTTTTASDTAEPAGKITPPTAPQPEATTPGTPPPPDRTAKKAPAKKAAARKRAANAEQVPADVTDEDGADDPATSPWLHGEPRNESSPWLDHNRKASAATMKATEKAERITRANESEGA